MQVPLGLDQGLGNKWVVSTSNVTRVVWGYANTPLQQGSTFKGNNTKPKS